MRIRSWFGVAAMTVALAACSGSGDGNGATETDGNAANGAAVTASYDPGSPEGRAYRAAIECAATMQAASSIIGGVSMSKQGSEREAYLADETSRRARAAALKARATELGTALGLTTAAIDADFTAHEGTFVQTASSGTMDQFGATVAAQANACEAELAGAGG